MYPIVKFFSNKNNEIFNFLSKYDEKSKDLKSFPNCLEWEKEYENPIEIATILGVFVDNIDNFDMVMWISLDKGAYIKITPNNADNIIRYLYNRYPY